MLKKIYFFLATFLILFCHNNDVYANDNIAAGNKKTLIVYYSFTHDTKDIVSELKTIIEADVIEVEPLEKGLDYAANNYRISTEQLSKIKNNPEEVSSYPPIDSIDVEFSNYSTIIIASPLWWSQMASNMQTFLFKHSKEMAGKNIGLIVSSHSSSISGVEADAKRLIPEGIFLNKSLWINNSNRNQKRTLIDQWLKDIDYNNLTSLQTMYLEVNNHIFEVELENNATTNELIKLLSVNPITYKAHDFGGFEKVGELGFKLPSNDKKVTTQPGDLVLYNDNQICIFFASNTWDYTYLGKIKDFDNYQLQDYFGNGNVSITLSLHNTTGIKNLKSQTKISNLKYNFKGQKIKSIPNKSVYIDNGRKKINYQ